MQNLFEMAMRIFDELTEIRRYLHSIAEGGFDTHKTTEYILKKLFIEPLYQYYNKDKYYLVLFHQNHK